MGREWSELKDFYMDDTIDELSTLGEGNKYFGYGAGDDAPSLFDPLSEREFSEVAEHINFHYDKVMKNISKSGSHDQFSDFIHKKGWLLFYNCLLKELNDEHMHQAAFAVLPGGVFPLLIRWKMTWFPAASTVPHLLERIRRMRQGSFYRMQ